MEPKQALTTNDYYDIISKAAAVKDVDITKLRELMQIREQFLKRQAKAYWNEQMAKAQGEMTSIRKDMANKVTSSRYASLAALDVAIRPIYTKYGFSVSFDEEPYKDNWIHVRADVSCGGYTKHYHRFLPWSTQGPKGGAVSTPTHANMGANTYVRRALLKNIFNLAEADEDDDGNSAGGRSVAATAASAISRNDLIAGLRSAAQQGDTDADKLAALARYGEQLKDSGIMEDMHPSDAQAVRTEWGRLREELQFVRLSPEELERAKAEKLATEEVEENR